MERLEQWKQRLLEAHNSTPFAEKKIVFGEGAAAPVLMMIGEAPGGDEEKQGRPFVGKAGKNLSAFLEKVGLEREEIYISNVVKLRPTKESPKTGRAVNILRADTKNVGGIAKGEMILGLPDDEKLQKEIEDYIVERGLEIEEVTGDV